MKGVILTMKKEIKVVAIVLVALIVFLSGFGLGATKGIQITIAGDLKLNGASGSVDAGATAAPTTTQPQTTTQAPTPSGDDGAAADTTVAPAGDDSGSSSSSIPSGNAEIAAAYNKAINDTKNYTGSVHLKKDSTVAITITDCPGGDTVKNIVQGVVDNYAGSSTKEYDYNNGADADGGKLYNRITPGDRDAALTEAGIANATCVADGDGYKMTITLVSEKATFDGTNTVNPANHESCLDPLNLATLDVNPITITNADMTYPGATLEVTVDGQGRMTVFSVKLPLSGSGTGGMGFIKATVGLEGSLDDLYTFTYA